MLGASPAPGSTGGSMKRFLLVLAVLALGFAVTGSSGAGRGSRLDFSGTTGRLAMPMIFGDRLLTINPDGFGAAVISYSHDTDPAWSPDGSALAVSTQETGNGDIYVLSPDGRQRRRLTTSDDRESDPSWAPGGYELAYERFHGDTAIYTVDADGSDIVRVTHDDGADANPAWSPDGSRIAFDRSRHDGRRIYTIRPNGGDELQVSIGPTDLAPAWSPDGRAILYEATERGQAVVATTPSGSGDQVIAYGVRTPAWQPIQSSGCLYSGTEANDIVVGGAGSDVVCGGGGDDHVSGGPGADVLRSGDGADILDAREGYPDIVDGGPGVDRAWVDRGDRTINVEDAIIPEPRNVARGRPVSASYWWGDSPPEFAVDG